MDNKPLDARLASWLVTPLIGTKISPNHLTSVRLVVGVAGVICFARGAHPNLGAWLIVWSNFLDHTDGELARLSRQTSTFGHRYDLASDAIITVGLFLGIGIGIRPALGDIGVIYGLIAGVAVAVIFQLRNTIESRHGKQATRQPRAFGLEAEDILYLLPILTWTDNLPTFLRAAALGAPLALLLVAGQYYWVDIKPRREQIK